MKRFKYRIRVPRLGAMGVQYVDYGGAAGGGGAGGVFPGGGNPAPNPAQKQPYAGQAVAMPGYGGQCAVFGYSKDPRTGERINIQVAMPGGAQRTFATEAQFQAACGGGGGGYTQPSYAAPQVVTMPAAAPQNISISLPGSSGGDSAWLAELARRSAQQDELIRQLALQRQRTAPPPAQQQPQTSWVYTPGSGGGGVEYAPAQAAPAETPMLAPASEKPATPWWIWAALGAGALFVIGKKVKK